MPGPVLTQKKILPGATLPADDFISGVPTPTKKDGFISGVPTPTKKGGFLGGVPTPENIASKDLTGAAEVPSMQLLSSVKQMAIRKALDAARGAVPTNKALTGIKGRLMMDKDAFVGGEGYFNAEELRQAEQSKEILAGVGTPKSILSGVATPKSLVQPMAGVRAPQKILSGVATPKSMLNLAGVGTPETVKNLAGVGTPETVAKEILSGVATPESVENLAGVGNPETVENLAGVGTPETVEKEILSGVATPESVENLAGVGTPKAILSGVTTPETVENLAGVTTPKALPEQKAKIVAALKNMWQKKLQGKAEHALEMRGIGADKAMQVLKQAQKQGKWARKFGHS